jgi:hypothetical protein
VMGVLSPEEQSRLCDLLTRLSEHLDSLSRPLSPPKPTDFPGR